MSEFSVRTDQKSLIHPDDQRLSSPWQQKALTKLLGLNYKIIYKKGTGNRVADALSRAFHQDKSELASISVSQPLWLEAIQKAYLEDETASTLLSELAISMTVGHFKLKDGLILYKGRIWIGRSPHLHKKIFSALHASAIGGHSGYEATFYRIQKMFAWPKMKQTVKDLVA